MHQISSAHLSIERIGEILAANEKIELSAEAVERIERCRKYLDEKIKQCDRPIYGITTGFGSLCNISIGEQDLSTLQKNLVMSHACGCGDTIDPEIVRIMLLTKVMSLSFGNSGVCLTTVQRLVDFFNLGILPVVYSLGSLGASGDLSPLANLCLPLLGLGEVIYNGQRRPAAEVLAECGLKPLELTSKEGLALLNGTQFMSSHAVFAILKARRLS
ncbi:MAG: aromatic amino acid ammonia-lyase, partial [Muribaculaceae bacterium]|nr:aromatic amino acid ammonia-lyase [Muribaculaceae bacterium]